MPVPLHPILVHFPIAFLVGTALVDLLAITRRSARLARVGLGLLVAGVATAVPAVVTGLLSEESVEKLAGIGPHLEQHETVALVTGGLALVVLVVRLVSRGKVGPAGGWAYAPVPLAVLALIVVTGFFGGRLVYDHGAGVHAAANVGAGAAVPSDTDAGQSNEDAEHTGAGEH